VPSERAWRGHATDALLPELTMQIHIFALPMEGDELAT
jgi:hypothetical protein